MCLAVPGKIISIKGKKALADFSGVNQEISVDFIKVKKNDYVLVYSGHAIEKVSKKLAMEIIKNFKSD